MIPGTNKVPMHDHLFISWLFIIVIIIIISHLLKIHNIFFRVGKKFFLIKASKIVMIETGECFLCFSLFTCVSL